MMATVPAAGDITLGLLAGKGMASADKVARVRRFARRFPGETGPLLVRAADCRQALADVGAALAPDHFTEGDALLADVAALAFACTTPWLLTLPVDVYDVNDCLVRTLVRCAGPDGAVAEDDDGVQPRVALYRSLALRHALMAVPPQATESLATLQQRLQLANVRLSGVRFGKALPPVAPLPVPVVPR